LARPLGNKAQKRLAACLVTGDLKLGDQAAVAVQDRGGVGIAVGVDPDDVVDLAFEQGICGCPPSRWRPWSAPAWVQVTARQDCEGSRPG
jgi:hypothetical protein